MKEKRTTVVIEVNLLKKAKQKAIEGDISLKELINEALATQLKIPVQEKKEVREFPFKGYHMGKIKGTLRRVEIYEDL